MGSLVAELAEKLSSATNNLDFDEQTMFLNTSADTVGIGTNAPASKFDVRGTMQVGVDGTGHDVKFFGATSGSYLQWDEDVDDLKLNGAAGLIVAGATDFNGTVQVDNTLTVGVDGTGKDVKFFGATATNGYMLWDESTDDLILGSASKVGIGTSTVSEQVTIANNGAAGTAGIRIDSYSTTAANGAKLFLAHSDHATLGTAGAVDADDLLGEILFQGSNGTGWYTGSAIKGFADETWASNEYGSYLSFHTVDNDTATLDERMRITQSGKVGIGTTNPDVHLAILGSGSTAYATSMSSGRSAGSDLIFIKNEHASAGFAGIYFSTDSTTNPEGRIALTNEGSKDGDFTFALRSTDNTVERMRITSAGYVGIGESTPNTKLHVLSGTASTDGVLIGDAGGAEGAIYWHNGSTTTSYVDVLFNHDNADLHFRTKTLGTPINALTIKGSGNIGIGTTDTQGAKLAIKSAAYGGGGAHASARDFTIEGSGDSGMTIFSGTSNIGRIRFGDSGDNAVGNIKYDHSVNLLGLGANGSDSKMVINSAGNIGIGTTAPRMLLDVSASGANGEMLVGNSSALEQNAHIGMSKRQNYGNVLFSKNLRGTSSSDNYRTIGTHGAVGYAAMEFNYGGQIKFYQYAGATTADAVVTPPNVFNINRYGFSGGNFNTFQRSTGASAYALHLLTVSNMVGSSGVVILVEGVSAYPGNGAGGMNQWTARAKVGDSSASIFNSIYSTTATTYNGSAHGTPVLSWTSPTTTTRNLYLTIPAWGGCGGIIYWGGYTAGIVITMANAAHG